MSPRTPGLHRQLGWYLSHLGENRSPEALAAFNRALAINPADSETYGLLGGRAKRLGDYAEAQRCYRHGVELAPGDPYMLINLAAMEIIATPHAPDQGVDDYRRLIALLNERQDAPDEWYELNLGEAYFAVGDDESALEHYELARSLTSSPKSLESAADQLQVFADRGFRPETATSFIEVLYHGVATRRAPPISGDRQRRARASSTSPTCISASATARASIASMLTRAGCP